MSAKGRGFSCAVPTRESENTVSELPESFTAWAKENKERIDAARERGTLPYFIKDNEDHVSRVFAPKRKTPLEIAEERHAKRTKEQAEEIKLRFWDRELSRKQPALAEEERNAITRNRLEIERILGIKKGKTMSIEEADRQSANPKFYEGKPLRINCATCTPAYMLRLWGFDVTAKGNVEGSPVRDVSRGKYMDLFKTTEGESIELASTRQWAKSKGYKAMPPKRYKEFYEEACKEEGVYYTVVEVERQRIRSRHNSSA